MKNLFYLDIDAYVRQLVMEQMVGESAEEPQKETESDGPQTRHAATRKRKADTDR